MIRWTWGLLILGAPLAFHAVGLEWNVSGSLPRGLYIQTKEHVERGSLVIFCLPREQAAYAYARGYIGRGFCPGFYGALLKPVAGLPGDEIALKLGGVWLNDAPVAPLFAADSQGRVHDLRLALGRYRIPEETVFVLSLYHPRSWDSRYFGMVPLAAIRRTVRPLWLWE